MSHWTTEPVQTALESVYFDICDLIESGDADGIKLTESEDYETLRECLVDIKQRLESIETMLGEEE